MYIVRQDNWEVEKVREKDRERNSAHPEVRVHPSLPQHPGTFPLRFIHTLFPVWASAFFHACKMQLAVIHTD